MSDSEKRLIVDLHNDKRRRIANGLETRGVGGGQPGATNMLELVNIINTEMKKIKVHSLKLLIILAKSFLNALRPGTTKLLQSLNFGQISALSATIPTDAPVYRFSFSSPIFYFSITHALNPYDFVIDNKQQA